MDDELVERVRDCIWLCVGGKMMADEAARAIIPLVLEHAAGLVEAERLEEPQTGTSDEAYEQALTDAAAAIRGAA